MRKKTNTKKAARKVLPLVLDEAAQKQLGAGKNWGNWRDSNGDLGILPPIYWMPLPEPPSVG